MTEIFQGIAGSAFCSGEIEIDGETHVVACKPGKFILMGGNPIEVRITARTKLGPVEELRVARWVELADHPLVEGFDEPPGGHIEATLRGVVIVEGDRISVAGEIRRGTKTDGYRGVGATVVRSIEAHWISVGTDAVAWIVDEVSHVESD